MLSGNRMAASLAALLRRLKASRPGCLSPAGGLLDGKPSDWRVAGYADSVAPTPRLSASRLRSERLVLDPLRSEHADELAPVLDDPALHRFRGGEPVGVHALRARFARQTGGALPDGHERWLNWVVRRRTTGRAIGTVQATISTSEPVVAAQLPWVIGTANQRQGFAKEAAGLVAAWLLDRQVRCLRAHIHPDHKASMAVARSIGPVPTDVIVDGEVRWESSPAEL